MVIELSAGTAVAIGKVRLDKARGQSFASTDSFRDHVDQDARKERNTLRLRCLGDFSRSFNALRVLGTIHPEVLDERLFHSA